MAMRHDMLTEDGFLVLADTLARAVPVISPIQNLPVGVITALLGAPFFVYLLRRRPSGS